MCTHGRLGLAEEAGFTLIEVLVASVILVIGLLGTFAMLDGASSANGASASREAANNLGREFLESVRGDAYTAVTTGSLATKLQGMPGYKTGSSPPVITRRNIDYTVTASVCSLDDPKDGLGTTDATFCSASTPTSPADNQPDDLKRVTVRLDWSGRRAGSVTQAAMLSSTGAVVGLPVSTFTMDSPTNVGASATAPIITSSSTGVSPCPANATGAVANTACFTASSTGASRIIFAVDGVDQSGTPVAMDSTCTAVPCPKWHLAWNYAALSDGVYRVTARSVDGNGVQGAPKSILVTMSRGGTSKPCGVNSTPGNCLAVEGGYNTLPGGGGTIFELRWQANPERNVVGYKVKNGAGTVVCTLDAQGAVTSPSGQSPATAPGIDRYACIDTNPPAPSSTPATYSVYAQYSNAATGTTVDGPVSTISQAGGGSTTSTTYADWPTTFGIDNRTTPAGCTKALTGGWNGGTQATPNGPTTWDFCTPAMSTLFSTASSVQLKTSVAVNVSAGGFSFGGWTGTGCTLSWDLRSGAASIFPAGTTLNTKLIMQGVSSLTQTVNLANPITVPLAQTLVLRLKLASPGSDCAQVYLLHGGSPPGTVTVTFTVGTTTTTTTSWSKPNAPTSVTKAASGSNTNISWAAPSGGNVAFYRIYRDGQLYKDRYDTCDVGDLSSAGGCDNGNGTFTYTDQSTGGTSHTYWVTAVYGSGNPVVSTLAESAQVPAT